MKKKVALKSKSLIIKSAIIVSALLVLIVGFCLLPKTDSQIYKEIKPSLVVVRGLMHLGSGVVISSDELGSLILTNKHVCNPHVLPQEVKEELGSIPEYFIFVTIGSSKNGSVVEIGQVMKVSENSDLCLIHVNVSGLKPAKIASTPAKSGDTIYSCGTPFGLQNMCVTGIMGEYQYELLMLYQFSTLPANPGQSGSGVFNADAELIGLISLGASNISGIVPLSLINAFLNY